MHTRHPEFYLIKLLPYEIRSKNAQFSHRETRRKVSLIMGLFSEDFIANEPTFELFQTLQTKISLHR